MAHDRQQRTHDTRQSTRGWQRLTWLQHVEEALLEIIIVEDQAVSRRLDQLLEAAATLVRHSRQLCRGRGRQHFNQCVWQAVAIVTSGCKLSSLLLGQLLVDRGAVRIAFTAQHGEQELLVASTGVAFDVVRAPAIVQHRVGLDGCGKLVAAPRAHQLDQDFVVGAQPVHALEQQLRGGQRLRPLQIQQEVLVVACAREQFYELHVKNQSNTRITSVALIQIHPKKWHPRK